jgi:hypothetical protein
VGRRRVGQAEKSEGESRGAEHAKKKRKGDMMAVEERIEQEKEIDVS